MDSGIEVVLDKWDLRPGHDAVAFMESMATDPTIDKVLLICDRAYSEKADGRHGGVGTETQIISKKVYEQVNQERFIALVAEKDDDGRAYTPTFYHSRLYIDLSDPEAYSNGFDELIRCIYNQPQYTKPKLGKKPDFLTNEVTLSLGTSSQAKRAITSIREGKGNAAAALDEYLTLFSENLERIRIARNPDTMFDEQVVSNIREFANSRNELLQVTTYAIRYFGENQCAEHLHHFLESLLKYHEPPQGGGSWQQSDCDNYKFIIHEIFLYTIGICLKNSKYVIASLLLDKHYYVKARSAYLAGFECFYQDPDAIENLNRRKELKRSSLSADITKEMNHTSGVDFSTLMQTDFLLFLRSQLHSGFWWPKTLVYLGHYPGAFEIFARSASSEYFEKLKQILKIKGKSELETFAATAAQQGNRYYGFSGFGMNWSRLMNLEQLETLP